MTATLLEAPRGQQATPGARGADSGPPPPPREVVWVTSMLLVLGVLLLTFVLEVTAVGAVRHARAQRVDYLQLRGALAQATAPTGQTDVKGKPLALGTPVALLEIPALGLREVVGEGTTGSVLQDGPGHFRASVLPGQAGTSVIMARQAAYGGPFRRIATLAPGTPIQVVTGQGTSRYTVTRIRHAGDKAQLPSGADSGTLTLVTGSGTAFAPTGAVWVDATLTSKPFAAAPLAFGAASLGRNESAMASDRSDVLQLFLWSQLLLLVTAAMVWLRSVWGRWQSWIVCIPVLGYLGFQVAHLVAQLLPNLL